jgi:hypothetical protein
VWHIESWRSIVKCSTFQANMKVKCIAQICRSKKGMLAPAYIGNNERLSYSPNPQIAKHKFWFCANDLVRCVMGTKRGHILTRPLVPTMWPMMSRMCLIQEEVHSLEDARFLLEKKWPNTTSLIFKSWYGHRIWCDATSKFPCPPHHSFWQGGTSSCSKPWPQ